MVNPKARIELSGSDGVLSLSPDAAGWSQVELQQAGNTLRLGAEPLKVISRRLIDFLSRRSAETKWVLSLSELHCSVYGEHTDGQVSLKIQNADGQIVATLSATEQQRVDWIRILSTGAAGFPST